jgi:hypothetical protein
MTFSLRLALLAFPVAACGGAIPAQSASARGIVLSERAAPSGYVKLQELTVRSGKGCGMLGQAGSREAAEAMLRNEAAKLGASYVQLTRVESPRPNHQCIEHEHKLSGIAYRSSGPSQPLAAKVPTPAASPALPAAPVPTPLCVPGATQACLGPGACQGAQACRDDATGFLPCDCGPAKP